MHNSYVTSALTIIVCCATGIQGLCRNVPTSEGIRDLPSGDYACGVDGGHTFIQCGVRTYYRRSCQQGLMWDNVHKVCTWRGRESCVLSAAAQAMVKPDADVRRTTTHAPISFRRTTPTYRPTFGRTKPFSKPTTLFAVTVPPTYRPTFRRTSSKPFSKPTTMFAVTVPPRSVADTSNNTLLADLIKIPPAQSHLDISATLTANIPTTKSKLPSPTTQPSTYTRPNAPSLAQVTRQQTIQEPVTLKPTTLRQTTPVPVNKTTTKLTTAIPTTEMSTAAETTTIPPPPPTTKTRTTTQPPTTTPPTPRPTFPPGPCSHTTCQLPDCFCYGQTPAMNKSDIPMFVMLTFDDAVQERLFNSIYRGLFVENQWGLSNPNNCTLRATFYVSHAYTNYYTVQQLYDAGNEIASHTIHHERGKDTYDEVVSEIIGQRDIITEQTNIPEVKVTGFRSPFLETYGDLQFDVLMEYNFTYDTSITKMGRYPIWPFTLDHQLYSCPNTACPTRSYPGLWEVPINQWSGSMGICGMIDGCPISGMRYTGSAEDWRHYFKSNFDNFYYTKVPMHMFTHASMFLRSGAVLEGLKLFMKEVLSQGDVWFVTVEQLIDWMKHPVTKDAMATDPRFRC